MFNRLSFQKIVFLCFLSVFVFHSAQSKSQTYYWVGFKDKNNTTFSLAHPEAYLSERAIQRRIRQNIPVDSLDLPVNTNYIEQVLDSGVTLVHSSKWLNGITVKTDTNSFENRVKELPFVKEVILTKPDVEKKSAANKFSLANTIYKDSVTIDSAYYGPSATQVEQLNGQFLHKQDYRGQGIQIAVIDAGFFQVDSFPAFDSLRIENRILGIKDFVNPKQDFFHTFYHGMSVLSCMAGNVPGELIGTAPKASYWLIRSEDATSEYLIEEDNWAAAAEYADSVGADIINSSLGYFTFDDDSMNHTYADMNGNTTHVTRAANIAASRGMLVFSSAGNEGNSSWKYIIAPSDGDEVIGVGAVDTDGEPAYFTSYGPASDGDVKPNVTALGRNTFLQKADASFGHSNGTSYSTPVMTGLGACLWQANQQATAFQIKSAIEQSASLYPESDSLKGYGIPDMKVADQVLKALLAQQVKNINNWFVYPNPAEDYIVLQYKKNSGPRSVNISVYSLEGKLLQNVQKTASSKIILHNLQTLPAGLLILKIETDETLETVKLSKIR